MKRPVSVALLQVALVLSLLSVLPMFAYYTFVDVTTKLQSDPAGVVLQRIPVLAALAYMAFVLWALWHRKPYGRQLGLAFIAVVFAVLVYGYFSGPQVYADATYDPRDGFPWGRLTALALLAWWFYAFGFTPKAKAFFAVERKQEQA
jgi:hypothetical protein